MQVGPTYWRCVTTDSAGVPTGGKYGAVRWFEKAANRRGMKIAWSRRYDCFLLYTEEFRGKPISQMLLRKFGRRGWGDPIAMTHELLMAMTYIREEHCKLSHATITQKIMLRDKQRNDEIRKGWRQADEDLYQPVMRRVQLRLDPRSRTVTALAKKVGLYNQYKRRQHKRKKVQRIVVAS